MGSPKEVMIACKRHCVLCEKDKRVNVECHHIIPVPKVDQILLKIVSQFVSIAILWLAHTIPIIQREISSLPKN
uniref:HNH endonuclease n=1 Tax=Siphoviridae sp. ctquf9 TaxID=2826470 RepID=A0A8S5M4S8_9CAUD|nr:MAG TPA: HNH endonuclease [Siphoviridae sp. ctquf9]